MAVFMLDDVAGSVEVVVFPETFGKHGRLIESDAMLLVRGKFEKDEESARIVATELMPIAALKERTTREVVIHLPVPPHGAHHVRGARGAAVAPPRRSPRVCWSSTSKGRPTAAARPRRRRAAGATIRAARGRSGADCAGRIGELGEADEHSHGRSGVRVPVQISRRRR